MGGVDETMAKRKKVRVAIVGVGNCAASLVQGVHFYKDAPDDALVPGLMHVNLGGYHVRDIEFTAAFDIDQNKVDLDLAEQYVGAAEALRRAQGVDGDLHVAALLALPGVS